jgi:hypothetical protein
LFGIKPQLDYNPQEELGSHIWKSAKKGGIESFYIVEIFASTIIKVCKSREHISKNEHEHNWFETTQNLNTCSHSVVLMSQPMHDSC